MSRVWLCTGKDCRSDKGHDKLRRALIDAGVEVDGVRCQDICKGPVLGVEVKGKVRWYAKLRTKERRAQVLALLRTGKPGELGEREVEKRRGKRR